MLYDKRWDKPTDPFHIDSLIAWLEQQPARERYCYHNSGGCLLAQYFRAMGLQNAWVTSVTVGWWPHQSGEHRPLPVGWDTIAWGQPFLAFRTYGGALSRARKLRRQMVATEKISCAMA